METAANEAGGVRGAFGALSAPRTGFEPLCRREGLRKPGLLGTELHEFNHQAQRLFPPLMTVQSPAQRHRIGLAQKPISVRRPDSPPPNPTGIESFSPEVATLRRFASLPWGMRSINSTNPESGCITSFLNARALSSRFQRSGSAIESSKLGATSVPGP